MAGTYASDFYAGEPALTVNRCGKGEAWYLAARAETPLLDAFYGALIKRTGVRCALGGVLPDQVSATVRGDGTTEHVFVINYAAAPRQVAVKTEPLTDILSEETFAGTIDLPPYGVRVFKRPAGITR